MATSRVVVCLVLLSSLIVLLSTSGAAETANQRETIGDGSFIQRFLTAAKSEKIINGKQFDSLLELALRVGGAEDAQLIVDQTTPKQPSVFLKLYNQFTLLNVVYFSGALLIMGAYTLFMTLALEKFNYLGLTVIMLVQVGLFGVVGVVFWGREDYRFVGGLFCTISTSMVPFLIYNLQRAIGVWPKNEDPGSFQDFRVWVRPGWVVMEIVTVVTGMLFLVVVRFPFLLFPVSFCLWFLSMDLAPLFPGFQQRSFEIRRRVSLGFGLGMMVAGFLSESTLGSDPDMGFWLYLFGTFTFWTTLNFAFPTNDLYGSLFLLVNICLVLVGSHLDRTTFHVFGTIGVMEYVSGILANHIKMSTSTVLWLLKAASATALLSQALRRDGNLEVLGAVVCSIAFNFNYIGFAGSGEHYSLLLLVTNLGLVSTVAAFVRPLSLWLFTLPDTSLVVSLIFSVFVASYHLQLPIKYFSNPPNSIYAYLYITYRLVASVLISFVFVFLRQPHFAWVGGLGIPLIALNFLPFLRQLLVHRRGNPYGDIFQGAKGVVYSCVTFILLLLGVAFSTYLQSNLLYLICCVFMFSAVMSHLGKWKILGCVFAAILVVLSVPLQSTFLITIGAMYIFGYLSFLAYDVFKNSLIFPLVLITLGLVMIYTGVQYQKYEHSLHETFNFFIPKPLSVLLTQTISSTWQEGGRYDWFNGLRQTSFSINSFVTFPLNWILWPGALTFALYDGPAPFVSVACGVAIVVLVLTAVVLSYRQSLVYDLNDSIQVSEIKFSLSRDPAHENHGIVITVKGKKPQELDKPFYLALNVEGSSFWNTASRVFGDFAVSLAK